MKISTEKMKVTTFDSTLLTASLLVSYLLHFDYSFLRMQEHIDQFLHILPAFIVIQLLFLWGFGVYKGIWRYSGASDLLLILKASLSSFFIFVIWQIVLRTYLVSPRLQELVHPITEGSTYIVFLGMPIKELQVPYAILVINLLCVMLLIGGERLSARLWIELRRKEQSPQMKRLLVVGAGDECEVALRELRRNPNLPYTPVGIVDDNPGRRGMQIHGIKVLGSIEDIPSIVKREAIEEILITLSSDSGAEIRHIITLCDKSRVRFKMFQSFSDILGRKNPMKQFPEIHVEDLLGREETKINLNEVSSYIRDKVILVTGAGGSIGSEICRQICGFQPKELILLGSGENSIFEIHNELRAINPQLKMRPVISNIQDRGKIQMVFSDIKPNVVFHVAAHKHVPLMELYPEEAVKNNIIGTKNIVEICETTGVERMINISSDKAVNPTSVMGISKRIAELYIQGISKGSQTIYITVRFGNVLGSRGSVVPIFQKQIARGGPVTVTDPKATRYFMTISEAARLVVQTGAMGKQGDIFILDMGQPINILDFAKQLIVLSGLTPNEDIPIEITGLRTGEKLVEKLYFESEDVKISEHSKIFVARHEEVEIENLRQSIAILESLAKKGDQKGILAQFKEIVPTFPNKTS